MADQEVSIKLSIIQQGIEDLVKTREELKRTQEESKKLTDKVNRMNEAHEKHTSILLKARAAIRAFHKEMFIFTFVAAAVIGSLTALSKASENLGSTMEKWGVAGKNAANYVGNAIDELIQKYMVYYRLIVTGGVSNKQAVRSAFLNSAPVNKSISTDTKIAIESLQQKTAQSSGNTRLSQELQLDVEFLQKIQPLLEKTKGSIAQGQLAQAWRDYRVEAESALRRTELGLKNANEIAKDFAHSIADAFEQLASDPVFKFLQGEKQTATDIIKGFQTNINKAISEAIGSAFKNALFNGGGLSGFFQNFANYFTGKNSAASVARQTNETLDNLIKVQERMLDCVCRTAENTNQIAQQGVGLSGLRLEGTITPSKTSALSKIGAIAGGIASIASLGSGGFGGAGLPTGAGVSYGPGAVPVGHTGGRIGKNYVRPYSTGGEVPITAQAGEFIVRRSVADQNKDFLKEFNMTGNAKSKGGNVFLIKANDAASFQQMLSSPSAQAQMEINIIRAIANNGTIRKVIKDFA